MHVYLYNISLYIYIDIYIYVRARAHTHMQVDLLKHASNSVDAFYLILFIGSMRGTLPFLLYHGINTLAGG